MENKEITLTLTLSEIEGLRMMLNIGKDLVESKLYSECRAAAEKGKQAVNVKEFTNWRTGEVMAKNFIARAGI